MAGNLLIYQLAISIMALVGVAISVILLRTMREWKWRQAGYKFAAALTLYSLIQLMSLTDIFYDPPWIMVTANGLLIIYVVYGIFNFRRTVKEEVE